ncbi:hypothetical protein PMAYCL1PPCAC_00161 [Pristionchus mayeri]|uniref:Uncharacterized protein n=1 Tax=Pristionchus mayeri TaxID=1317129 RepID=A0AAN4YZZ8_9BILA|nr:hypothetical protein PMAYCL1PPCAC_00161 [Pristionchus mayeri]
MGDVLEHRLKEEAGLADSPTRERGCVLFHLLACGKNGRPVTWTFCYGPSLLPPLSRTYLSVIPGQPVSCLLHQIMSLTLRTPLVHHSSQLRLKSDIAELSNDIKTLYIPDYGTRFSAHAEYCPTQEGHAGGGVPSKRPPPSRLPRVPGEQGLAPAGGPAPTMVESSSLPVASEKTLTVSYQTQRGVVLPLPPLALLHPAAVAAKNWIEDALAPPQSPIVYRSRPGQYTTHYYRIQSTSH